MSGFTQLRFLIGASLAIVIGASTDADDQTTALRGARVVDGRGGAPIDNATIVIRGGRIVAIGSSSATPSPMVRRSSTIPAKLSFRASSRATLMLASSLA